MYKARLMAMMFLEFFIWGAWYVTVGNYMAKIEENDFPIVRAFGTIGWIVA
jgi:hypothetical protein